MKTLNWIIIGVSAAIIIAMGFIIYNNNKLLKEIRADQNTSNNIVIIERVDIDSIMNALYNINSRIDNNHISIETTNRIMRRLDYNLKQQNDERSNIYIARTFNELDIKFTDIINKSSN